MNMGKRRWPFAGTVLLTILVIPFLFLAEGGQRIINGRPAGEGFPQVAAIGYRFTLAQIQTLQEVAAGSGSGRGFILPDQFFTLCTATLVGNRTLVSAAHCVENNIIPESFPSPDELSAILLLPKDTFFFAIIGGREIGISKVTVHPDYDSLNLVGIPAEAVDRCGPICAKFLEIVEAGIGGPVQFVRNDIAVLTLKEPVEDVVPFSLTRREPVVGQPIVITGYGLTNAEGFQGFPDPADPETPIEGNTAVGDFDGNSVYFFFKDLTDSDTCFGDSGGPLFTNYGSGAVLIGIVGGGTSSGCWLGDIAWNERVDIHVDWIDEVSGGNVFQVLN